MNYLQDYMEYLDDSRLLPAKPCLVGICSKTVDVHRFGFWWQAERLSGVWGSMFFVGEGEALTE